ncbi:MAG: hypothetical protein KatS3mg065_1049 [Chloroflexota bacterium]|nr:MAG: hypothetical protein KatS3mg065_1049 [Chloroflexota bacterium]
MSGGGVHGVHILVLPGASRVRGVRPAHGFDTQPAVRSRPPGRPADGVHWRHETDSPAADGAGWLAEMCRGRTRPESPGRRRGRPDGQRVCKAAPAPRVGREGARGAPHGAADPLQSQVVTRPTQPVTR